MMSDMFGIRNLDCALSGVGVIMPRYGTSLFKKFIALKGRNMSTQGEALCSNKNLVKKP